MTALETKVINEKIDFINNLRKWLMKENAEIKDIKYKVHIPVDEPGYSESVIIENVNGGHQILNVTGTSTWSIAIDVINMVCV